MNTEIKVTVQQLQSLLDQQKENVIEILLGNTGFYNPESTTANYVKLAIDKEKFKQLGLEARFPDDFAVLKRYID